MDTEYRQEIVRYYDHTRMDYRWLWFNRENRAVHFGYYDQEHQSHHEALENLNRQMALRAGIRDGDRILDAGCGQGGSAFWLVKHVQVQVSGITLVPHQVEIARTEMNKRRLADRLDFSVQDYCDTRFEDESFDVVWACESMCHALDKRAFYREAFRLLKPGGRLICADYIRASRPLGSQGEKLLHDWLDGWSIRDLDTREEHVQHAGHVGFSELKIEDVTAHTEPSLAYLHRMSTRMWTLGKVLKRVGLRNKTNHGNQYGSIKQYEALRAGHWFYAMISAVKE